MGLNESSESAAVPYCADGGVAIWGYPDCLIVDWCGRNGIPRAVDYAIQKKTENGLDDLKEDRAALIE
jgi:hypothetical protein